MFSGIVLVFTLFVILWGDFVQISGSGDGCGAHWPTCKGDILPGFESAKTNIEFVHRATSGLLGLLTAGLLAWAFKAFPKGSVVRFGALMSFVFVLTEGLFGAALVLLRKVGTDASVGRVVIDSLHLVNTMILIGFLALTNWWAVHPHHRPDWAKSKELKLGFAIGAVGILLVAILGAISSLGDAIFPVGNTAEAIDRTFAVGAHFLERIRTIHPFVAVVVSIYTVGFAHAVSRMPGLSVKPLSRVVSFLFLGQLLMGLLNVRLAAPVYIQLPHLLLADLLWMAWVVLTVAALSQVAQRRTTGSVE